MGAPLILRTLPAEGTETGLRLLRHADEVARLEATLAADLGEAPAGPLAPPIRAVYDAIRVARSPRAAVRPSVENSAVTGRSMVITGWSLIIVTLPAA